MTKTPDEIKNGLKSCHSLGRVLKAEDWCKIKCPYMDMKYGCGQDYMHGDALAYIQQLEAERDAAVALIPRACAYCKWYGTKHGGFHPDCKNPNGCRNVSGINTGWQWRGVQKEE